MSQTNDYTYGFPPTPGPFYIVPDHTEFGGYDKKGEPVYFKVCGIFSASEIGPDNIDAADPIATMNENWGEFDSTARLLSASHDMLAALESARSAMSAIVAKTDEQKEALKKIEEAIDLAKSGRYAQYGDELYPQALPYGVVPELSEEA